MKRNLLNIAVMGAFCSAVLDNPNTAGNVASPTPVPVPTVTDPALVAAQQAEAAAKRAAQVVAIKAQFNNLVDIKETKYFFKKVDVEGPDPTGAIDPATKAVKIVKLGETKRPTIELPVPVLSVEGIVKVLENGKDAEGNNTKSLDLLLEAVADVTIQRARDLINDNEKITGVDDFPMDELSWEKIANLPKAERRGGGIAAEIWEAFSKDYITVMPSVTGKSVEQVANAAKILLNKFNQVKTIKPVLTLMKEQLGLYTVHSPNAETYSECVKFLVEKADNLLNFNEQDLLKNL